MAPTPAPTAVPASKEHPPVGTEPKIDDFERKMKEVNFIRSALNLMTGKRWEADDIHHNPQGRGQD